jgi:hypothetical protein
LERILTLLNLIEDEEKLARILWFIERCVVRTPPSAKEE